MPFALRNKEKNYLSKVGYTEPAGVNISVTLNLSQALLFPTQGDAEQCLAYNLSSHEKFDIVEVPGE